MADADRELDPLEEMGLCDELDPVEKTGLCDGLDQVREMGSCDELDPLPGVALPELPEPTHAAAAPDGGATRQTPSAAARGSLARKAAPTALAAVASTILVVGCLRACAPKRSSGLTVRPGSLYAGAPNRGAPRRAAIASTRSHSKRAEPRKPSRRLGAMRPTPAAKPAVLTVDADVAQASRPQEQAPTLLELRAGMEFGFER